MTVEQHVVLGQMLALGSDAVHVVIAHSEGVGRGLAVCSGVCTCCGSEAVQTVVCIGMRHLASGISAGRKRGIVRHREDIAYSVEGVVVVHDGRVAAVHREVAQATAVVVSVERLRTVAVLQVAALLELVVAKLGDVVVTV